MECVIRTKDGEFAPDEMGFEKALNGSTNGESNGGVESILKILLQARSQLQSLAPTALQRAIAVGLYSREAAQDYWHYFTLHNLLPYMSLTDVLSKVDSDSPKLAIACVTIAALTTTTDSYKERELFIDDIYEQCLTSQSSLSSADGLQALAILCFYALPLGERGLVRLRLLDSLCRNFGEKQAILGDEWQEPKLAAVTTIFSVSFATGFEKIEQPIYDYTLGFDGPISSLYPLVVMFRSLKESIRTSLCMDDLTQHFNAVMPEILKSQCESPLLLPCFLIARIKLIRSMVVRCVGMGLYCQELLNPLVEEGMFLVKQLTRRFCEPKCYELVPSYLYFFVCDACIALLALRYSAFCASLPVDVNVECVASMIKTRWEQLSRRSIVARQNFRSLLPVQDLVSIRIGILDPELGEVRGPGSGEFKIYGDAVEDSQPTREDLANMFKAETEVSRLPSPPRYGPSRLSLRRLIKILVCEDA